MRRRAKVDANHKQIVEGLRAAGFTVASTAEIGGGFPDICVAAQGFNILFEIKADEDEPLTKQQQKFHQEWPGQVAVIWSLEHALELLGRRPRI